IMPSSQAPTSEAVSVAAAGGVAGGGALAPGAAVGCCGAGSCGAWANASGVAIKPTPRARPRSMDSGFIVRISTISGLADRGGRAGLERQTRRGVRWPQVQPRAEPRAHLADVRPGRELADPGVGGAVVGVAGEQPVVGVSENA